MPVGDKNLTVYPYGSLRHYRMSLSNMPESLPGPLNRLGLGDENSTVARSFRFSALSEMSLSAGLQLSLSQLLSFPQGPLRSSFPARLRSHCSSASVPKIFFDSISVSVLIVLTQIPKDRRPSKEQANQS